MFLVQVRNYMVFLIINEHALSSDWRPSPRETTFAISTAHGTDHTTREHVTSSKEQHILRSFNRNLRKPQVSGEMNSKVHLLFPKAFSCHSATQALFFLSSPFLKERSRMFALTKPKLQVPYCLCRQGPWVLGSLSDSLKICVM